MEPLFSKHFFCRGESAEEDVMNSSGSLSSVASKPFCFELPTNDKTLSGARGAEKGVWRDNSHRKFCSLHWAQRDVQASMSAPSCVAFNNKLSVSLLRLSADCEEGSYFKLRNLTKNPAPLDYYSAIAFDRQAAPLLAMAGHFTGVELVEIERQKTFIKLHSRGVECLSLVRDVMLAAERGPNLRLVDLRESTKKSRLISVTPLPEPELLTRVDQFDTLMSLNTHKRGVCIDLRNPFQPIIDDQNLTGLTFLSQKTIHVNFAQNSLKTFFSNDEVQIDGEIVDASFDYAERRLLILCKKDKKKESLLVFDQRLSLLHEVELPSENFKRCLFLSESFAAVVSKTSVSTFSLEENPQFF